MEKTISAKIAGDRLRKYRLKIGYTQSEFGSMLNLAQNTICKYETEGINELDTILDINQKLGINLLEETEDDKEFMDIVLRKVYKWYNYPRTLNKNTILTKKDLQERYLFGYGKNTKALEYILKKLEEKRLIKVFKNKLKQEDTNMYIMITAKSVLRLHQDQETEFPMAVIADNITDEEFQELINRDESKKETEEMTNTERQDAAQKDNEVFISHFNKKKEYIIDTLNKNRIALLLPDEINTIIAEGIMKKEKLKKVRINNYFNTFRDLFPESVYMLEMIEETYESILAIEKDHLVNPVIVNRLYNELIQLICNIVLIIYRKTTYGMEGKFLSYPQYTKYEILPEMHHLINAIHPQTLVKDVLPLENFDAYDEATTYLLLNSIILYLSEDEDILNEDKSIESIIKLLIASNNQKNIEFDSPLDKIFAKFQQREPYSKACQYYTSFKMASFTEQLRAVTICLKACFDYCQQSEKVAPEYIQSLNEQLLKIQVLNKSFKKIRISYVDEDTLYLLIYSETLESFYEEKKVYDSLRIVELFKGTYNQKDNQNIEEFCYNIL